MLLTLSLHDELVGPFVIARLVSESGLSPRRHGVITLYPAFATAVRVIDWIHNNTAICWPNAHMARAAGFTDRYILVVQVPDLADSCTAVDVDQPDFA
jgi:hypothetical protein